MKKRKVCIVTGTRAEYGLLYWVMKEIQGDDALALQTIVTGTHLSKEFGLTYKIIEKDGFKIDAKVDMKLGDDSSVGVTRSLGLAVEGFGKALAKLKPDVVVVLGDRYEVLAAAQAAMIARIPIAHLHGGELTEGLIDEAIRHSITKMSHLHFTATEPYRKRVIQLGEDPARVFNVGATGLDNIFKLDLLDRSAFEKAIDFKLGQTNFLVTYHPVTLETSGPEKPMRELLAALDEFPEARVVFTKTNADMDGRVINKMIDEYVKRSRGRAIAHTSLGQVRYLSALKHCDVVIGNSSSGLIEVPAMGKATVNLGDRQRGRLRGSSVVDCAEKKADIANAIRKALSPAFQKKLAKIDTPYGSGGGAVKIKNGIKNAKLEGILKKRFHDL